MLKYTFSDFYHLCVCKKRKVVGLVWDKTNLVAYGVNHGMSGEPCECVVGVRTEKCTHAEDMIFNVDDPEIYRGCVLEINWFPCGFRCSDNIIKYGVKAVCWTDGKHFEAIEKLESSGVECFYGTYEQYLRR